MIRKMIEIMGLESHSGPCMNYLSLINNIFNLVGQFDFLISFVLFQNIQLVEYDEIFSITLSYGFILIMIR
jgi:hypothetical protein